MTLTVEPSTIPAYTSIKRLANEPAWELEPIRAQGGAPDLAALGVNFADMCYEDWRWAGSGGYFEILSSRNHPAFINLTGAGQYNDALKRAQEARNRLPQTRLFWRHMIHQPPKANEKTDKGLWRLPAHEFVDNIVIAHRYHEFGLYVVTDCEGFIARSEVKTYAEMEAERLDYGVPKGARFGVLRMSTHHPSEDVLNSGDLDPLLAAIGRNMGNWDNPRVVITLNGYFDDSNPDAPNYDGLFTARRIEQRCITKFGFRPIICFGEIGFDQGLDSEGGWRRAGLTAQQNISRLVKAFSKVSDMAGCAWTVGFTKDAKVANFHLDHESLKLLMQQSPVYAPPGPVIDPPVPPKEDDPPMPEPPPPEIGWIKARLNLGYYADGSPKGLNVRSSRSVDATINATVKHDMYIYYREGSQEKAGGYWWLRVKTVTDVEGYGALLDVPATVTAAGLQSYIDKQFVAVIEEPPPPPDTEPEPPKPPTDREYAEKLIALHQREAVALDKLAQARALEALTYNELAQVQHDRIALIQSILERTKAT